MVVMIGTVIGLRVGWIREQDQGFIMKHPVSNHQSSPNHLEK